MTKQQQQRQRQKEEALKRLELLGVMNEVVEAFGKGRIYLSEYQNKQWNAVLYSLDALGYEGYKDILKTIQELETRYNVLVYHMQLMHTTDFGDMYSFLYVSDEEEYWCEEKNDIIKNGQTFAWVINDNFTDCGMIGVRAAMGGVLRVW